MYILVVNMYILVIKDWLFKVFVRGIFFYNYLMNYCIFFYLNLVINLGKGKIVFLLLFFSYKF